MNEKKVNIIESAIQKIHQRNTPLIIQPDGLPNSKWSKDVGALRILKALSIKYHKENKSWKH